MKTVKSYTDELAAWSATRKKRKQDATAVAFLAVRGKVEEAISAGYAVLTIWEHMTETGRLKCSYETFRKHVTRFVKQSSPPPPRPIERKAAMTGKTPLAKKKTSAIRGFTFNSTPNKEELV